MKAKQLAEELLKHPDFDVQFMFNETNPRFLPDWSDFRVFENVCIGDIGYSSQVICLDGEERI